MSIGTHTVILTVSDGQATGSASRTECISRLSTQPARSCQALCRRPYERRRMTRGRDGWLEL